MKFWVWVSQQYWNSTTLTHSYSLQYLLYLFTYLFKYRLQWVWAQCWHQTHERIVWVRWDDIKISISIRNYEYGLNLLIVLNTHCCSLISKRMYLFGFNSFCPTLYTRVRNINSCKSVLMCIKKYFSFYLQPQKLFWILLYYTLCQRLVG